MNLSCRRCYLKHGGCEFSRCESSQGGVETVLPIQEGEQAPGTALMGLPSPSLLGSSLFSWVLPIKTNYFRFQTSFLLRKHLLCKPKATHIYYVTPIFSLSLFFFSPGMTCVLGIHWTRSHNFFLYSLNRTLKDKAGTLLLRWESPKLRTCRHVLLQLS